MEQDTLAAEALATLDDRSPEWRKTMLSMYDQGASDSEIMKELGLSLGSWESLYADVMESDFKEIVDYGRLMARAWWDAQGRINLFNKQFNTSLWVINMKNRFGWSEKTEQSLTNIDYKSKDDAQLMQEIKQRMRQLGLREEGPVAKS